VAHARCLCAGLLGERGELLVGHDRDGFAVAQHVGELVGLDRRVERHERGAGAQRRVDRDRRLGAVGQQQRDAVAACDAERVEAGRERAHGRVELGVRHAPLARDDGLALR
jgi:hypothetical protein